MKKVTLYTDGACKGNPGKGGWGALLMFGEGTNRVEREMCGGEAHTTNNRMEMLAVISGLRALKERCEVIVYTDSSYVQKGISEWIVGWKKNGWKTAAKQPVKNVDLWQALDELAQQHAIVWRWVKGHAGDVGNERADRLANLGIEKGRT